MQDNPELKSICEYVGLILMDSQIIVKWSKFLGSPIKERVCMSDFVCNVLELAVAKANKIIKDNKADILSVFLEYQKQEKYIYHYIDVAYNYIDSNTNYQFTEL